MGSFGSFTNVAMDGKCHSALKGSWYSEYLLERTECCCAHRVLCAALRSPVHTYGY